MKTLCIIPCGGKKIWDKNNIAGPVKACEVYIGPPFKKFKEYAERFYPDSYYILSAKHGFLLPNDIVPQDYNVSFNGSTKEKPITIDVLMEQVHVKGLMRFQEIVVLGGKDYVKTVEIVFKGKKIIKPLGVNGAHLFKYGRRINKLLQDNEPYFPEDC